MALYAHAMSSESTKVWFITGASTGFGRVLAEEVLAAGDRLVATARDPQSLADLPASGALLVAQLDVTDGGSVRAAVAEAVERFGHIDVLVNNAGYGHRGAVEELTDADLIEQFDTNVFGVVRVTREVLPHMRAAGRGRIIQLSSVAGVRSRPGGGAYAASKFALEGLSEALALEVDGFGIKVTLIEPGPFRTDFAGRSSRHAAALPAYEVLLGEERARFAAQDGQQPNDPRKGARIIIDVAGMATPPLRLPLGPQAIEIFRSALTERLLELDQVADLGRPTAFD